MCGTAGMQRLDREGHRRYRDLPTPRASSARVSDRYQTPDSVLDGWPEEFNAVADKIYADFNKKNGTDFKFQLK